MDIATITNVIIWLIGGVALDTYDQFVDFKNKNISNLDRKDHFKVFKSFESASTSNFLSYYSFNEGFIITFNEDTTLIKILGNPTILEYDINLPKEKNNKNGK